MTDPSNAVARLSAAFADLVREGTVIGPHDLLIGATALAQGYLLATLNRKEFSRVAGLGFVALDRFFQ